MKVYNELVEIKFEIGGKKLEIYVTHAVYKEKKVKKINIDMVEIG